MNPSFLPRPTHCRGWLWRLLAVVVSPWTVALLAVLLAPSALGEGPPNPLCFTGASDYAYADDRLWIYIQKRVVTEPKLVTYFVCDIQTTDPHALKSAISYDEKDTRKPTSVIAQREGAVLAINGDGFGYRGTGIVMRNGTIRRARSIDGFHLLMLDSKGGLSSATATQFGKRADPRRLAEEMLEAGVSDIWCFGPELVRDSEAASFKGFAVLSGRTKNRAPRTAIGQIGPLHYVVVVADGRQPGYSNGINLPDLQQIFLDLGVRTAFNLDGGGSTTLCFRGEVINIPCDIPERATSDILYFN